MSKRIDWVVARYHFAHSNYVSFTWNWFLELCGKGAAAILVGSVLYAGLKVTNAPFMAPYMWADPFVNLAQNLALDMGGLGLLALAKQARVQGNTKGANQARIAGWSMFVIMVVNLALYSLSSAFHWSEKDYAWFVAILLVTRAILAVSYGVIIHDLGAEEQQHHSVVKSSDVRDRMEQFTERLNEADAENEKRIQQMNEEMMKRFSDTLQQYRSATEYHIRQMELATEDRLAQTSEKMSEEIRSVILALTDQQSNALQGVVMLLQNYMSEQIKPLVDTIEEHEQTLSALPLLSEQIGHIGETTQGQWSVVVEEITTRVQATLQQHTQELPKIAQRIVDSEMERRTDTALISVAKTLPKKRITEKEGAKFDKRSFVVACLESDSSIKPAEIQRRALELGQTISASYISETRGSIELAKSQIVTVSS